MTQVFVETAGYLASFGEYLQRARLFGRQLLLLLLTHTCPGTLGLVGYLRACLFGVDTVAVKCCSCDLTLAHAPLALLDTCVLVFLG